MFITYFLYYFVLYNILETFKGSYFKEGNAFIYITALNLDIF